jgi:hypothetical protein
MPEQVNFSWCVAEHAAHRFANTFTAFLCATVIETLMCPFCFHFNERLSGRRPDAVFMENLVMSKHRILALSLAAGLPAIALAQPSLLFTGFGPASMTPDGQTVAGAIYDAGTEQSRLVKFNRTTGYVDLGGNIEGAGISISADGNAISYTDYNRQNLNNATNSITYNPAIPNMWERTAISYRWSSTGQHQNLGVSSTGNRCDFSINTPYDISDDGRYTVGGGWTGSLCGAFRALRHDAQTNTWLRLPFSISAPPASAAATANRANAVNADGSVIVGYDQNYNSTLTQRIRRPAVWVRNSPADTYSLAVLDENGGEAYGVSADGNTVIGNDNTFAACRWTRTGITWTKTVIAGVVGGPSNGPQWVNNDGTWVLGPSWIWNAGVNGGVAQNLETYLAAQGLDLTGFSISSPAGSPVWGLSDNGRSFAVRLVDSRDPCLSVFTGAIINLDTVPCRPPSFVLQPVGDANVVFSPGYYYYGVIVNANVSGTGPLNYQWQKQNLAGDWIDMIDDAFCTVSYLGTNFNYKAVRTSQLRVGFLDNIWQGNYRCVVTGPCGTVTSDQVTIAAPGNNCDSIDFNRDGLFPDDADLVDFLSVLAGGPCTTDPTPGCSDIDYNNDGLFPDDSDLISFLRVLAGGSCTE